MMFPYMTLYDDTEIVHSKMHEDGKVKVYIETPDEKDGFHHATCWLPEYKWEEIYGYEDLELERIKKIIKDNAYLIIESSNKKTLC